MNNNELFVHGLGFPLCPFFLNRPMASLIDSKMEDVMNQSSI